MNGGFDDIKFENLFEHVIKNHARANWHGHTFKLKRFHTNVAGNFFVYEITSV